MDSFAGTSNVRALEFYCGIGGLHFALRRAVLDAVVVAAFDVDQAGNRVYALNTGLTPTKVDIGTLTVAYLDELDAAVWLLSPPCQPYTRQGLRRGSQDPRARSFLSLLQTLAQMRNAPECVFLENVVGFECSETRLRMLDAFERAGLTAVQEFVLSPEQFGVPYSRPRYFCLARKRHFPSSSSGIRREPPFSHDVPRTPLRAYLNEGGEVEEEGFEVPLRFLEQCADVMNVVSVESTLLNCFTKSYGGRYFKGTGSFLATKNLEWIPVVCAIQSVCCAGETNALEWHDCLDQLTALSPATCTSLDVHAVRETEGQERRTACRRVLLALLKQMGIRYFTPSEVAALHSFPPEFTFPNDLSRKRQYALVGNSLSVSVVAELVRYMIVE